MYLSQLEFLRHILDECTYILSVTEGKKKDEVLADGTLTRAIIRSLEIIGEASKKIDLDFRSKYPEIEWKKMAATRDVMIHDYFGIDYDIVWSIIKDKLPDLEHFIKEIINKSR